MEKRLWQTSTLLKSLVQIADMGVSLPLLHEREAYPDQQTTSGATFTLIGTHEAGFRAIFVQQSCNFYHCLIATHDDFCGAVTLDNKFANEVCENSAAAETLAGRISDYVSAGCMEEFRADRRFDGSSNLHDFRRHLTLDGPSDYPMKDVLGRIHQVAFDRFKGCLWPMARRAVSETMIPINQVNLFSPENTDEENALEAIETLKEWGCFASLLAYKPLRDKYRWWHLDSTLRNWFEEPKALKEFAKALGPDNDDFVPNAIATQALVELSIELTPFSDNRDAAWRLWKTLLHFAEEFEFGLQRDELITGEDEVFLDAARGGRMIARFLDADGWLEKVVNGRVPLPPSTRLRKQHYVVPDGDQQSAGMAMASVIRQNVVTSLINASFGRQIVDPEAYYDPTPANAVVLANLRALVGYERSSYFEDQFDQAEFESDREVEYQEAARNFVERLLDEVFPVGDQTRSRWMLIADLETFSVR